MVREALTGYWTLVNGLTDVTVERARMAARAMLAQGEATRDQVAALAQEIIETSRSNREALLQLVRYESERATARLGFASTDEVTTLQGRVRELERSVAELRAATEAALAKPQPAAAEPAKPAKKAAPAEKAAPAKKAAKAPARKLAGPPAKAAKATKSTPRKRAGGMS